MPELSTLGDVIHEAQAPFDSWKGTARVATTAVIVRSGLITVDSIALVAGDVVLDQHAAVSSDRGFYIASAGAWARASNALAGSNLDGAVVRVLEGTINGDKTFAQNASPCVVDVDAQTWLEQAGGGSGEHSYTDQVIGVGESRTVVDGQQMLWSGVLTILGTLTLLGTGNATDVTPVVVPAPPVVQPYPSKIVYVSASQAVQFGYIHSINDSGVVLTIPSGAQDGDMFAISSATTGASLVASGGTTIVDAYRSSPASSIALEEVATGDTGQRLFIDIFVYSALPNVWAVLSRTNYPAGPLGALPIVSYGGGGTFNALPGVCYRITADCIVAMPAVAPIRDARIAVIKDYVGSGPTVAANGGDALLLPDGQSVPSYVSATTLPIGARLEWQSSVDVWRLLSTAVVPAQHLGTSGAPVYVVATPGASGQVLKLTSPSQASWQNEAAGDALPYKFATDNQMEVGKTLKFATGTILFPTSPAPVDGDLCAAQSINGAGASITLDATGSGMRMSHNNYTTLVMRVQGYPYFRFRYFASLNKWNLEDSDAMYPQLASSGFANSLWLRGDVLGQPNLQSIPDRNFVGRPIGGSLGPVTAAQARDMLGISGGSYLPTIVLGANVASVISEGYVAMLNANAASVSGRIFINTIGAGDAYVDIPLPFPSDLTNDEVDCAGIAVARGPDALGWVVAETGANRARLVFTATAALGYSFSYSFLYRIY